MLKAYSDITYVGTGPRPGPIKFNCFSSHISCTVKVKHKIMQAIFFPVPVPVRFKPCLN